MARRHSARHPWRLSALAALGLGAYQAGAYAELHDRLSATQVLGGRVIDRSACSIIRGAASPRAGTQALPT
jgi:hypothetical protein